MRLPTRGLAVAIVSGRIIDLSGDAPGAATTLWRRAPWGWAEL